MPHIRLLSQSPKAHRNKRNKYIHTNKWRKFYGTKMWRDLREQKLVDQPLCERCLEHDKITPATTVHHRKVFGDFIDDNDKWFWFLNYDNLISLCAKCHKEVHDTNDMNYIEHYK